MGRSRVWTMAASPVPVAVTTSGEFRSGSNIESGSRASPAERREGNRDASCRAAPLQASGGYWVSSNRAVTVTVSLTSPASIGVGAAAPPAYAREKAMGGCGRPLPWAPSAYRFSRLLRSRKSRPSAWRRRRQAGARLVEQRARIVVAKADAVGAVDLKSLAHLRQRARLDALRGQSPEPWMVVTKPRRTGKLALVSASSRSSFVVVG